MTPISNFGHKQDSKVNAAIISSGTGLSETGLCWDGHQLHPFATERGHSDFGPRNELDVQLVKYFHQKYEHISWEESFHGPGMHIINRFFVTFF